MWEGADERRTVLEGEVTELILFCGSRPMTTGWAQPLFLLSSLCFASSATPRPPGHTALPHGYCSSKNVLLLLASAASWTVSRGVSVHCKLLCLWHSHIAAQNELNHHLGPA